MRKRVNLKENPFYLNDEQIKWVENKKKSLTTKQKIGQLFCVMGGDYSLDDLAEMIEKKGVGAVLYRPAPANEIRKNFEILDKVATVPILKAANLEEGGAGGLSDGTMFGWPMTIAATDCVDMVQKFATVTALEGKTIGINWTFSPVSDLDLNFLNPITNVRSYGSDLARVKTFTAKFAEVVQENGIAACAKHFPGDGVDFRDHHLHPTYNSLPADRWYETYGTIYQNMIEKGLMSIMVGHIVQPEVQMRMNPSLQFEDCLPASLSKEVLTGVLREEFGFNGVITTDATIMGGYCMSMARKDAIPASIMAGCDMIVFNTCFADDYQYMENALRDGRLTEERLDEAITRILALKAKVINGADDIDSAIRKLESIDTIAWQKECADQSVTLVKNIQNVLPLTLDKYPKIRLILLGKDEIIDGKISEIAISYLEKNGFQVHIYNPLQDDLHGLSKLPKDCVTVYLANMETASNQTTVRIKWCEKHALDIPRFVNEESSIFISFANPYCLQDIPRVRTYINAYTATKQMVEAALEKVTGKSEFKGISPVDAFCGLADTRI